jgi:hypothetical protein
MRRRFKKGKYTNEFYVTDDCRENMHGTEIYLPGCKWFDMKTKKHIKTKDLPAVFERKHLHFTTKKKTYLYSRRGHKKL